MKTKQSWFWFGFIWLLLMVGEDGNAAASLWKVVKEPHTVAIGGYRLFFADAKNGWIVGYQPSNKPDSFVGFRTQDGGNTWREIHIPDFKNPRLLGDMDASSVFFLTSQEGWIGGAERIALLLMAEKPGN